MSTLVDRLLSEHPVTVAKHGSASKLRDAMARGFVRVTFEQTRGDTELGVRLDGDKCRTQEADFENARGTLHIEGTLRLDFVAVRAVAAIDLATLKGTGRLLVVGAGS